jgi:tetratricopeptide (TPR) repeat protein
MSNNLNDARKSRADRPVPEVRISKWKNVIFAAIAVLLVLVAVEVILTVLGVRPILYDEDPYVGFSSYVPLFVEQTGPNGQKFMVTAKNKLRFFNPQRFAAEKAPGAYRIFCAGGSTTFGRPYDDMTSFCGWLREMLPKADPSRRWELINVGGISYASYRVALLMEELIQYEPDLFIIYTGHNEFLERRTYSRIIGMPRAVRGVGAILSRTRIYSAIDLVMDAMGDSPDVAADQRTNLPGEVETLLEMSKGPESYHRDIEMREKVFKHYRYNLMRMVDIARSAGAEVILVTPASNLRHCRPFKSQHRDGLSNAQRRRWRAQFDLAGKACAAGGWFEALTAINNSIGVDDRYAQAHYLRGSILWELQRYDEAKAAFTRAMDEDVCALRAPTPLINRVAEVAAERDAALVDFVAIGEGLAEHSTAGEDLFLDHIHLTIESNRLLALAILDAMSGKEIVRPSKEWGDDLIEQIARDVEAKLNLGAHGRALRNIARIYRWAGKFEEGRKIGLRALEMVGNDAEAHFVVGANALELGYLDEAIRHYRRALDLQPDYTEARNGLGDALIRNGRLNEAISQYQQVLKTNPGDSCAYVNLAVAMLAKGELDEAIRYFRTALEIVPDDADAHNGLGTVLVAQGKLGEALEHFSRAIKNRPHHFSARYNLASVLRSQGKYDEAVDQFQQILRTEPDNVHAFSGLGLILHAQGMLDEAVGSYLQALEIEPDCVEAHSNLGDVLSEQGKPDEAMDHYRTAIRTDPNYARAHCNLGVALCAKGELQEAVRYFRQALMIDPFYAEAHNNLGGVMLAIGQVDRAINHFRQALQTSPEDSKVTRSHAAGGSLAKLEGRVGRYSHTLRPETDYARMHHNLGRALARKGDLVEALKHYRKAAGLRPAWPLPLNDAARILATHPDTEVRDVDEAIRFAARAAELSGRRNVSMLETLALVYAAEGQFRQAVTVIEEAIALASAAQAKLQVDYLREKLQLYQQSAIINEPDSVIID